MRKQRGLSFRLPEIDNLLSVIQRELPDSWSQWERVAERHYEDFPKEQRTAETLKRKFNTICRKTGPTRDPKCPQYAIRAKAIRRMIIKKTEGLFGGSDDDDVGLDNCIEDEEVKEEKEEKEEGDGKEGGDEVVETNEVDSDTLAQLPPVENGIEDEEIESCVQNSLLEDDEDTAVNQRMVVANNEVDSVTLAQLPPIENGNDEEIESCVQNNLLEDDEDTAVNQRLPSVPVVDDTGEASEKAPSKNAVARTPPATSKNKRAKKKRAPDYVKEQKRGGNKKGKTTDSSSHHSSRPSSPALETDDFTVKDMMSMMMMMNRNDVFQRERELEMRRQELRMQSQMMNMMMMSMMQQNMPQPTVIQPNMMPRNMYGGYAGAHPNVHQHILHPNVQPNMNAANTFGGNNGNVMPSNIP
eukprot:CAMPEP_0201627252 /NCGR_PEP_ID=MMETSP0493-20130528/2426_1 /ASSEMBLY_ACC=CAM_ASM_000838 /TAXON_ID=420259 /ORGANISM="Thalassiosira gravida, Strain GMp14c1" /LENGTH=412 /DNA_ID=CAMNT_0048097587 /DNA_START=12 /DNA_END=1246 /DNA_ORIENTATION=-